MSKRGIGRQPRSQLEKGHLLQNQQSHSLFFSHQSETEVSSLTHKLKDLPLQENCLVNLCEEPQMQADIKVVCETLFLDGGVTLAKWSYIPGSPSRKHH